MINRQTLFLFVTALLLSGCAILPRGDWPQSLEGAPPQQEIESVPFYPQEEYQCGPASLAMALAWSGLEVKPAELTDMVYTASRQGSLQPAMIAGARRFGRLAYVISGTESLLREVAAGHPVIVLQNLGLSWIPLWHYAVVVGYDMRADKVILHSGINPRQKVIMRLFQHTWARSENWGLLVLKPQEMPVMADESRFVEAVLGLEKARQVEAAMQGYRLALSRWPQNFTAMMGLGNASYALGDLKSSEDAFRRASEIDSQSGPAFNNLAHVLLTQGRHAEARIAAQRAVVLGGPLKNVFEETLREIQSVSP
jgi:tetratricopeptide (TPR) repeat protein